MLIDDLGRLPTVTFPSGAKIEGLEENTLTPGIVVTIIERKFTAQNIGYFNKTVDAGVYIYKITAVQNPETPIDAKTYVTTTEKPIKVTLPNTNGSEGITLAGIKESDTDPWRLFNYSDTLGILSDIEDLRASKAITDNSFNIFRLGIQFALIVYEGNTGNRLPESYVSGLNASSTASIMVKDGKYLEDLAVIGILKGINLESIKPTDLRARITYRNNKADEAPLRLNGVAVNQTNKADKTVPGSTYYHTFVVESVSDSLLMNTSGEYTFILNLSGVETDFFSDGFLIEFFNKVDSEKILPYNYTEFYTLNKKEVINVTIKTDSGEVSGTDGLYELNPTFVICIGKELSDGYKEKVEDAVHVTDVESDKITKKWNGEGLTIGFSDELEPDTIYTLSVDDITDVESISIKDVEDFTFKTRSVKNAFTITYNLDGGEVATPNPTTYTEDTETFVLNEPIKPGYTFIGWTGSNGNTPQKPLSIFQGSNSNLSFVANYAPITYTITYELDGGTLAEANPDGYNTASETFILHEPTKLGYEFVGWTGSNGNTPQMNVSVETGSTENRTYTANFTPTSYSITYNAIDGCNFATANPVNYDITSATININTPTKLGYEFIGWTGSNGNTPQMNICIETGSTENKTYTANFIITSYSITYNGIDGCNFATANPESYDITSATIGLNPPTRTGYEFLGWTSTDIAVPQIDGVQITQGSTGDKTFTANWHLKLNLAIAVDDDMLIDDVNNLYYTKSTFTITPDIPAGLVLTASEKANIVGALSVKDSASNSVNIATASWNNEGKIALSFTSDLNASSTFSIAFGDADGMTLNCATYSFKTFYYKGRGIDENRFQVENATQLGLVGNYLNKHFVQTADIDIATYTWVSIGYDNSFTGSYYGNGFTVKNLKLRNTDNWSSIGLFGYVEKDNSDANSGKIASVTIDGFSVRGSDSNSNAPYNANAGIVACNLGENCSVEYCKLIDSSNTGCLVKISSGINFGFITSDCCDNAFIKNCIVENITMNNDCEDYCYFGGISSFNHGTIENCSVNNCNFTHWYGEIGGICWSNEFGSIKNCSLVNSIIYSKDNAGGICAREYGGLIIENCIVDGSTIEGKTVGGISNYSEGGNLSKCKVINGTYLKGKKNAGGICECSEASIDQCYISQSAIEVTGGENNSYIGGISGYMYSGIVTQCYVLESTIKANMGNLCYIGGICGKNQCYDILQSYVLNTKVQLTATGDNCNIGGICGGKISGSTEIKSCYFYYDKDDQAPVTTTNNNNKLGLFMGSDYSTTKISDCFTNKSGTLIGQSVGTVTNCYDGVENYSNFSGKTWSDGAWDAYKVGADKPWPLDLNELPRD